MKLGEIMGVSIMMDPILLTILAGATLLGVGREPVMAFFFVFLHELSHTLAALALGVEVEQIELFPFGGVARSKGIARASGLREGIIALAGPAFNFLCAGACYYGARCMPEHAAALLLPLMLNLGMGCFNLLPAFPLDGGRMLRGLLSRIMPKERATRICAVVGMLLGIAVTALGVYGIAAMKKVNPLLMAMGVYLFLSARRERDGVGLRLASGLEDKRKTIRKGRMEQHWITAGEDNTVWEIADGIRRDRYLAVRVVDADMRPMGTIYEDQLMEAVLRGDSQRTLGQLLCPH